MPVEGAWCLWSRDGGKARQGSVGGNVSSTVVAAGLRGTPGWEALHTDL